ncbi:MAG: hypothetical protein H0T51_04430 [Pirellulales bacterium]|nr:hypothetical protein [Pirellulales bacterium]
MNDESLTELEQQLALSSPAAAPSELRVAVLADVRRELAASRWDRRLARAAAALVVVGASLNIAMGLNASRGLHPAQTTSPPSQQSLVQTAVAVARATDAETGRRIARQMAAWGGRTMTHEQLTALDAAMAAEEPSGKEG